MKVEKDYRDFLRLLGAKKAKYLIVGGFAYSYHAEPRYTKDIDLLVEATEENGKKVVAAIAEFWRMKPEIEPAEFLRSDTIIQLGFAPVRIDIITSCAGIEFRSAPSILRGSKKQKKADRPQSCQLISEKPDSFI